MGGRINTIMQSAFFALSGVLPREEALAKIKDAIRKSYERKGSEIVKRNVEAVDLALSHGRRDRGAGRGHGAGRAAARRGPPRRRISSSGSPR